MKPAIVTIEERPHPSEKGINVYVIVINGKTTSMYRDYIQAEIHANQLRKKLAQQ